MSGNDPNGRTGWFQLGAHVVRALAPQFLALLVVNVLFLMALWWFVDARAVHSMEVINRLLNACLEHRAP